VKTDAKAETIERGMFVPVQHRPFSLHGGGPGPLRSCSSRDHFEKGKRRERWWWKRKLRELRCSTEATSCTAVT